MLANAYTIITWEGSISNEWVSFSSAAAATSASFSNSSWVPTFSPAALLIVNPSPLAPYIDFKFQGYKENDRSIGEAEKGTITHGKC